MSQKKIVDSSQQMFSPSNQFIKQANVNSEVLKEFHQIVHDDYLGYWRALALSYLHWDKPFKNILNTENAPFYKWFEDGYLSVSYNCLDRHVLVAPDRTAIIFESDDGVVTKVSYKELLTLVCSFANGLKQLGVKKGDRLIIYMPHSIEAIVAMHACIRLGAIHSVVFGGFSAKALADRIIDADASYIITASGQKRGGRSLSLKKYVDEALELLPKADLIKNVIVHKRNNIDIECNFNTRRDIWWHDLIENQSSKFEPVIVDSEHTLFILYTSGSTGSPKGVQHSSAGYLLGTIMTMLWVFDIKPETDIFWCTADIGWITGHSYVCYGPLAVGATQLIFEGVPTYPDASRFWQMIDKHKVSIFYTAPTAIRTLIKIDATLPSKFDLSSLRLLGTVGESINPEAWMWYYEQVGRKRCPIVDTWWQTETGMHVLSAVPGTVATKPGSCTVALPGVLAKVVDESGNFVGIDNTGYLVITKPFPSQIRNIWRNSELYIKSYYPEDIANGEYYVSGDLARIDEDGYFWILGRMDDVLNVSGHRLGTAEVESALSIHHMVAEVAVVGRPDDIKGESLIAFIVCKDNNRPIALKAKELKAELNKLVVKEIGAIAKPDEIRLCDSLPKTRSGKVMRRLLRDIANNEEIVQDLSTLENPAILEQLYSKN
jgi:acetyl-CoA synthetase